MIDACIERALTQLAAAVNAANARRATAFDPLRGLYVTEAEVQQILTQGYEVNSHPNRAWTLPPLTRVTTNPKLHDAVAIAVAAQYVPRLDRVFGFLHDDLTRRSLSSALLVEMLAIDPHDVSCDGTLSRLAILTVTPSDVPLGDSIRIDAGFLAFLRGETRLDARIRGCATQTSVQGTSATLTLDNSPLVLWGAATEDLAAVARATCAECGRGAIRLNATAEAEQLGIAAREALLRDAILVVQVPDPAKASSLAGIAAELPVGVVIEAPGGIIDYHGASQRVSPNAVSARMPPAGYPLPYGRRLVARRSMDDLILPPAILRAVQSIADRIEHRDLVTRDWGVDSGSSVGGVRALFVGPSGTGKTLAAECVAHALGRDLYIVDLSMVVSKYIGETEKALATIFAEATRAGVCLFFDEADALFGKRTRAKDAHDRYANIETAYLLQALDLYPDIVILATNLAENIDDALTRRIDIKIDFAMPDLPAREKIWHRSLGRAPLGDVDIHDIAKRLQLSGGSIQSAALAAAYRAAAENRAIETVDLLRAARDEFAKAGRVAGRVELGEYDILLRTESLK
ncbi:MAG: ATP-binding protein [Candidatus Eremiobacteraeota bacterium]|nr:ATP-binding protein [Candidatus Eremiobacteraeota bacterium]